MARHVADYRREEEIPPLHFVHLASRSDTHASTRAAIRARVRFQSTTVTRSSARAALTYRVDRGHRKRDEEILLFLEAA